MIPIKHLRRETLLFLMEVMMPWGIRGFQIHSFILGWFPPLRKLSPPPPPLLSSPFKKINIGFPPPPPPPPPLKLCIFTSPLWFFENSRRRPHPPPPPPNKICGNFIPPPRETMKFVFRLTFSMVNLYLREYNMYKNYFQINLFNFFFSAFSPWK